MSTIPAVSSSDVTQQRRSGEDDSAKAAYRKASDLALQSANAVPYTANVPFMYNNNQESSGSDASSIGVRPIPQGGVGDMQERSERNGGRNLPGSYERGPTVEQVRYQAQGQQGPINYNSHQSPPAPINVDLSQGLDDGNARIYYDAKHLEGSDQRHESLTIETRNGNDAVRLSEGKNGGIVTHVNGQSYAIPFNANGQSQQSININTGGGDDAVAIDHTVKHDVNIDLGEGNDKFFAGSGKTKVFGGDGDDVINLGSGESYAEGGRGDDIITGGQGHATIYGGPGSDELRAGGGPDTKINYVDGGDGKDVIFGGRGHNILVGGNDDDFIYAGDKSTIITGKGQDWVQTRSKDDHVIGQNTDDLSNVHPSSSVIETIPSNSAGQRGIVIQGSEAFKQRVNDDLETLRSTRSGQETLKIIDSLQAPVTLREGESGSFYHYSDPGTRRMDEEQRGLARTPAVIYDGIAGVPAQNPVVEYDRTFSAPGYQRPPVVVLQHELSHAVNGGQGTIFPNSSNVWNGYAFESEPNYERQAVGLDTNYFFDFDNNPWTLPTNTNPWPYNENALLRELKLPIRQRYGA
ncbi:M91 family zinc metallopeptidase [Pseudomonas poae]|uniref:Hemolysin-like protein n=1 Tax=Pseudomonas poae TaxID=200451 RepID=A0A2S9EC36_9PSED|nr:M91 family zinc metallopeptidase [Pseudomonas poae]PRA23217.1 hemolysin-like protein [Pseudomonas poae]PRC12510.1 hemolysin-like protein [Pseudomonas poae]